MWECRCIVYSFLFIPHSTPRNSLGDKAIYSLSLVTFVFIVITSHITSAIMLFLYHVSQKNNLILSNQICGKCALICGPREVCGFVLMFE